MEGYPRLIIGDAVTEFKRTYNGKIEQVQSIPELKDLISYYTGIRHLDRELVIEDISFLGVEANSVLLKFVEESPLRIILLSRYDKVDKVLLSRIKDVQKYYTQSTTSMFLNCKDGNERIQDMLSEDSHYYDKVRYMSKFSPKLIMIDKAIKVRGVKNKIFDFVR